ncbi:protein NBR1 homolog [Cicer arietinum]|uniref:protein NBR1 homolog n=1 Tax=Cicer arietinum TaxID=3827 RepID=UPI003CC6D36A
MAQRHSKIPPHILKTMQGQSFILDINALDGTKIWRIRTNGTLVWPKGTQLVWIGGDKLSDLLSVDLEVPKDGVLMEKELGIAVEFRALQLPALKV